MPAGDLCWREAFQDPTKVVRTALENAASVAIVLLTTDALVSDLPEKEKEKESAPAGHHH